MLQNHMPGKTIKGESRKFVVILERIQLIKQKKTKFSTDVSFLLHEVPTENWRKTLTLIGVEKKQSRNI